MNIWLLVITFGIHFIEFTFPLLSVLISFNTGPNNGSSCTLSYNNEEHWLQAVWKGFINPLEAQRGAEAYLYHANQHPSPYLLNDNSQLHGPWFESLDWLGEVWVPQAQHLGLHYVAHVIQADRRADSLMLNLPLQLPFELQLFQETEDACNWLREMRDSAQVVQKAALTPGSGSSQATTT
jgi:hypothetical protein